MIADIRIQLPVTYIGKTVKKLVKSKKRYYIRIRKTDKENIVFVYSFDSVNLIGQLPYQAQDWIMPELT